MLGGDGDLVVVRAGRRLLRVEETQPLMIP
jgi:hypothetical protein